MAVAPGNTLFQLKKGGILAPAIFANLGESQEAEVRERPKRGGMVIFWLHRWESSGRMLSFGKAGWLNRIAAGQCISLQFLAQPRKPLPSPHPGQLSRDQPPSSPDNSPGSSWRRHFPFGPKRHFLSGPKMQSPAKKKDTVLQNKPSFLIKMSTFWPSIPNRYENFTIKTANSRGPISTTSSVWQASLLPCCLPGFCPFSAELTLCKVLGDAGDVKETNAQLPASVWIRHLDSYHGFPLGKFIRRRKPHPSSPGA